ncbi:glycosyltransferase family 2 protein [Hydrogenophaga sp.]|uniref:glycosyltransferase family 2 protein n=1 Tax=Hydrogenophaga sp. TaxID=1904254 RepID=UPI0035B4718C
MSPEMANHQPIALTWRQRLRLQFTAQDLVASVQIEAPEAGSAHPHLAIGPDPQFRLRPPLPAGWYMAEVALEFPGGQGQARFYLDQGHGESEDLSFGLPVRSGQVCKRLLRVDHNARLRFDPLAHAGPFTLRHFRLVRMLERSALQRIQRKLRRLHPRHKAATTWPDPQACWADYNALFEFTAETPQDYARWIAEVEAPQTPSLTEQKARLQAWALQPRFSVIVPTWNTRPEWLRECLDSVLAQTYPHWELCIADDASTHPEVRQILADYAQADARIRPVLRERNGHISAASNSALALASGDFVALLDHDDTLAPHALFAVAEALQARPTAQLVYSDEDKLDEYGARCSPFFKPDWSPDLLFSQNYVSHLGVYRRELVQQVGGFREGFEGSQDYDLLLRCIAQTPDPADIVHVPQVLYHWRMAEGSTALGHDQKDYASEAGRRALQEHMDRHHPGTSVSLIAPGIYRSHWPLPSPPPLVSLIVPTRDGYELLKTCIDSILQKTDYPAYEILVVDNQSRCEQTLAYLSALAQCGQQAHPSGLPSSRVRVLRYDHPFNYSAINNHAVAQAYGSVIGLINNDIEVISPDWLTEMVSHAVRPDVGCVGAKLLYPDDTIQHAGVVLGIGGVANHALRQLPASSPGYFGRLWATHNPSAVTGACLLMRKAVFDEVGGLDAEHLRVAFNDVDLCLKVLARGYRNLCTPHALLYHHESATRGPDQTPEKRARFESEVNAMRTRWGALLDRDPAYNPNLSLIHSDYSLGMVTP